MIRYLTEFEDYLKNEKSVSKNTFESYMRDLRKFLNFLTAHSVSSLGTVDEGILNRYIDYLFDDGKSSATVTRSIASIKCFFQCMIGKGYLTENPVLQIRMQRCNKKAPQILSGAEVELLLNSPDITDDKGIRDRAMLEVLYATGIRVSELIALDLDCVDLNAKTILCRNERCARVIPLYPQAVCALERYLYLVRSAYVSTERSQREPLFMNLNGKRLTRQGFWKIVKIYARQAGIRQEITPHTLRHSFAVHLLKGGASLNDVKDILGHADISSTQVYSDVLDNQFRNVYNKCHPKAKQSV